MNEEWNGDENLRNLYQQIAGSLNYAAQLRPDLMFSVSQLSHVMSCPTQENLSLARQLDLVQIHQGNQDGQRDQCNRNGDSLASSMVSSRENTLYGLGILYTLI